MKNAPSPRRSAALALSLLVTAALALSAQAGPAVSAKQALELAEEALAPKNTAGTVYIESLVLARTSLVSGKNVWTVTWSESVTGSKPGSVETGLEIQMDGSVIHLIKGRGGNRKPQPSPH